MPSLIGIPTEFISRLQLFRTQTLANFDPDEKKDTAEVNSYMDMIGLDSFQVPVIPTENSRAGLYIYVHAAVGLPRPGNGKTYMLIWC